MKNFKTDLSKEFFGSKLFEKEISREESRRIFGGVDKPPNTDKATVNSCCANGCDIQPDLTACYCIQA